MENREKSLARLLNDKDWDYEPLLWERAFLVTLAATGLMGASANLAGISYRSVCYRTEGSVEFAERKLYAKELFADSLELEAIRRAVEGWDEPVFQKGELCGYIRKYDSQLLQTLLKAYRPDKFDRFRGMVFEQHLHIEQKEMDEEAIIVSADRILAGRQRSCLPADTG